MKHVLKIVHIQRILSDGSQVHDIRLGNVILEAVTLKDADSLAEKLAAAIEAHTSEQVHVAYETVEA